MLELLKKRRSIRKYKPDKLQSEEIKRLLQAALLAPTSKDKKSWNFIVVDDETLLKQLALSKKHGSKFIQGAPLAIVVLGDAELSDVWVEDASIAAAILHLTAADMNLGSCWIQIRNREHNEEEMAEEYIRKLLTIPEKYKVEAIVAIGYPDQSRSAYEVDTFPHTKVHSNQFGNPWQ